MPAAQSKRRSRAPRLTPEERRASLIAAGIHVVARRGLEGARPVEVAREAGVSEATVYTYFASREDMVQAVLDEVGRSYTKIAETAFSIESENGRLKEQFAALFEAAMSSVDTHPDHARVWFNWGTAIRDDVWPRYLEAQQSTIKPIVSGIRRASAEERADLGMHPNDLAYLVLGIGEIMARRKLADASPRAIRRFVRSTLDLLFPSS